MPDLSSIKLNHVSRSVKIRQDLSGYTFILMYAMTFACQVLCFFGYIPATDNWYMIVGGIMTIVAYAFLYSLSNNISCQIFAATLIVCEAGLSFGIPYLMSHPEIIGEHYIIYLSVCICLCVLAIYLWLMLITNNPFKAKDFYWLVFLPMPYVFGLCSYWAMITLYAGHKSLLQVDGSQNLLIPLSWVFVPIFCVGFWKLCHSQCFSNSEASTDNTAYLPVKRFLAIYTAIVVMAFLIL